MYLKTRVFRLLNLEAIYVMFFGDSFFFPVTIVVHHHLFSGKFGDWIVRLYCYTFSAFGFPLLVWKKKKTLFHLKCINDAKFVFDVVRLWLPVGL